MAEKGNIVKRPEMKRFMVDCMTSVGADAKHAEQLADTLVHADYRGHYSHGLNRLDMYVKDIQLGVCAKSGEPQVKNERAATAWVEGNNLLGPVVGNFCMQLAITKAKEAGVGWVCAKGSNHYGIAGHYSMQAMEQGLLGMSFTNTSPLMVPTRAKKATLGTNPLTLAAPGKNGDSFVLDMATTGVAVGKIELADRKGQNIPEGWGVDNQGKTTTDPKSAIAGGLHPLGGSEITCGFKGYGLGMLVEIFCGILSGGAYGYNVRKWMNTDREADLGQCFVAIDPSAFAPGFEDRLQDLMDYCRKLEKADGEENNVLVAGDPEKAHMELCDKSGGIPYHPNQIEHAASFVGRTGISGPAAVPPTTFERNGDLHLKTFRTTTLCELSAPW